MTFVFRLELSVPRINFQLQGEPMYAQGRNQKSENEDLYDEPAFQRSVQKQNPVYEDNAETFFDNEKALEYSNNDAYLEAGQAEYQLPPSLDKGVGEGNCNGCKLC